MGKPFTLATTAAAAAAVLAPVAGAAGGIIQPGETTILSDDGFAMPQGTVVAQAVLPFTIQFDTDTGGASFLDFDGTADGTLTNTVVRDGATGTLAFVYDVDLAGEGENDPDASEASIFTVERFGGFSTDVAGLLDFESVTVASRTADGSAVRLSSDDPGLGGLPRLVVRTDATDFDDGGSARFFAGDELVVLTPEGLGVEFASGTVVVSGTFEPAGSDDGGAGGGGGEPTPIPLPPAAWTGLAVLGGVAARGGLARLRGRRRGGDAASVVESRT